MVKTGLNGLIDVTVSSLSRRKDIAPYVMMVCEVNISDIEAYIQEELELFEYPSKSLTYELSPLIYVVFVQDWDQGTLVLLVQF